MISWVGGALASCLGRDKIWNVLSLSLSGGHFLPYWEVSAPLRREYNEEMPLFNTTGSDGSWSRKAAGGRSLVLPTESRILETVSYSGHVS